VNIFDDIAVPPLKAVHLRKGKIIIYYSEYLFKPKRAFTQAGTYPAPSPNKPGNPGHTPELRIRGDYDGF